MDIADAFMAAIINAFEANKRLADRAVGQLPDDKLHVAPDGNTNSIAVIMKHVAGNLISRWTDFLTTDGEKPWRNRDDEFVDSFRSRPDAACSTTMGSHRGTPAAACPSNWSSGSGWLDRER